MRKILLTLALALSVATMSYAKSYGIWIMGVQVTDANKNDVLGNGMFSFIPCTNPQGTVVESRSILQFKGGTLNVPFTQSAGKFTYDCFLFVPYTSQSSWTKNTTASYSADEYIKRLYIHVAGENHVINTFNETKMDTIHHEGIFSRVPTTFYGPGSLHIKGFNHFTIHVKDDVTFESGRYFLENTLVMDDEDGSEWHTNIYQEGDNYTLTFGDAFFKLTKGGHWYSSVIFGGSVNSNGIGAHVSMDGHVYKDVHYTGRNLITREWGSGANASRLKNVYIYPKLYPILLHSSGVNYDTWVTWANHDDVLNDGGSVRYDLESNTLFLEDATINLNQKFFYIDTHNFNISCFGQNRISGNISNVVLVEGKDVHISSPDFASYKFLGSDTINNGVVASYTYARTGKDSLLITSTQHHALWADISVEDMTVVCQSPTGKDAFNGTAEAELVIDNGNYAMFGNETYFPIAIDGVQMGRQMLNTLNQTYGSQFSYDAATNTVTLTNANMSGKKLKFIQRGKLIVNGACQLGSVVTDYDLDIVAPGTLTCSGKDDALIVAGNKTVNISGGGSLTFTGRLHGFLCGSTNYSGNLTVNNTSVTFSTTTKTNETVSNMGSLILKKAVITAPANAQFVASKNSVCVNRVPTTANVVIAPTTSDAMISEVTLTADVESVRDGEGTANLSAFVKGNGTAKLYAQWYRKDDDDQLWWTSGSQITISATDALAGKTLEKTFSPDDENSAYIQYRLMVRTGNTTGTKDTLYSNVLEMPIAYKVRLKDGGYNYWINDEHVGHEIMDGESEDLWVLSSDSVQVGISNDCIEDLGNTNLYPWYNLGDGRYSFTNVKHSAGSVNTYWKKLDIKFYSSTQKSSSTLIQHYSSIQLNPFVCDDSFDSRGRTVPTAPEKESPFVGWLDDIAGVIHTQAQMETLTLRDDRDFVAIYEEDLEDPTAIKEVPAAVLKSEKILFNGQVYILHNDKLYNVSGMEL